MTAIVETILLLFAAAWAVWRVSRQWLPGLRPSQPHGKTRVCTHCSVASGCSVTEPETGCTTTTVKLGRRIPVRQL